MGVCDRTVSFFEAHFRVRIFSLFDDYWNQICINNYESIYVSEPMLSYLYVQTRKSTFVRVKEHGTHCSYP